MAFIKMLIGLPILLIVLVFAFMNNDLATFSLWPLNFEIEVSLSVMIVLLIAIGFLLGNFFLWMSYAPLRRELRSHKKSNKKLSKEQNKLVKEMEGLQSNLEEIKHEEMQKHPKTSLFEKIFKKKSVKNELVK